MPQDDSAAFGWFMKAAKSGSAQGQYYLGQCYEKGLSSVKPDIQHAIEWYHKAAEQQHLDAQYRLGQVYEWDVRNAWDEAVRWYRRAAEGGHDPSKRYLRQFKVSC